ncbi:hypothetical protein Bbelb_154750, partial [Branchiostoma belcheri]
IDECASANGGCEQTCTNNVGSFICSCPVGYSLNAGGLLCDDVNECGSGNGGCAQTCTNNVGSFQCSCGVGYTLNVGGLLCDDVDECEVANGGCDQACSNTVGSFDCTCGGGYTVDPDGTCHDIDECASANGGCGQTCTNNIGSFICSCGTGYILNGGGLLCDDVNECASANGGCAQTCTNNVGSFVCSCGVGYTLNVGGLLCDDVDECASANGGCAQACTNTIGSYNCGCGPGYTLNGALCDDIDECATANGGCEQTCTNNIGSFQCSCSAGYNLNIDGLACDEAACPVLSAPANGAMTGSHFYQDVATFTCDSGYDLVGNTAITCQADTTWSGPAPTCTRKECPLLTAPVDGAMSGSNFYQDVLTFTCDPGYDLVGNPTITCQADATWSGTVPTCTRKECPLLSAPTNGAVTGSNFYQDVATFTCDTGYNLAGDPSLTCQADATWSAAAPTCTLNQCPLLTAPANGAMTGTNFYQDVATFTCDSGYDLVGNTAITCQADATWSGAVPTCTRKECPLLTAPTNGANTGSNFYQDVATFTCNSGYDLVGSSSLTCQADATWSGTAPTCTRKVCPLLTAPANGAVTGSNLYEDVSTFTCDTGYNLVGSSTLTCQADATWSGAAPTCARNQCPLLSAPTNGAVTGTNFYQDVVTFTCDSGYDLVGSSTLTCQADTTWSGAAPTCTRKECPLLTAPANGAVAGANFYQDVATFTCDTGYNLVGNPTLTCQADATWSGNAPICQRKECPLLTAPANGAMTGSNFYQDVVHFTCGSGYDLVGNPTVTCQADATWSGTVPTCTRKQCPLLTAPANGAMTGSNFYQDVAQFTCDTGYDRVGNAAVTCQADATWSGNVPTCTLKECPLLSAPTNGAMTGTNFYQDMATFTCDSGYDLVGNPILTCQADATWDLTVPICTRKECPLLAAPANGAKIGSNFYQDVLHFACGSGYDLVGNLSITCQADATWSGSVPTCTHLVHFTCIPGYELDGRASLACRADATWSGNVPTCTRIECPLLTAPANGAQTGSNFYQDAMYFSCYSGFDLVGNSVITCQADETWTAAVPTCTRVQCPLLTAPVDGAMTGSNYYQDMVEFTCNSGYDRVGTSSLTCQADRTWTGVAPTCTRVECPLFTTPVNGGMTGGNFYQDVVLFTCDTGYELVGLSSSLTCQADRTWDGTAPSCTRVECPALIAPVNGEMTGFNFYQDVMQFSCDSGYDLIGSVSLTCQADRTWSGSTPTCTRVQCPVLPSPMNGVATGPNFYMDTVHFTCNTGYYLIGDSSSTCRADQSWSNSVPSCSDINECSVVNGGCDHVCTNTMGTFHCSCVTGYTLDADGYSCSDINECNFGNGGCQQNCINLIGSFHCSCGIGYELNSDGLNCDDKDECFIANGGCDQTCSNTIGSFFCSCGTGYVLNGNGFFCDDINECLSANGGCQHICTNVLGSFQCSCLNGYILNGDGLACDDVDECSAGNGGCEQTCTNLIPSFQCSCDVGYNLNVNGFSCDDVDECSSANGGCQQTCTNNIGSFQCSCLDGYNLNADGLACDDVNECSNANGGCGQTCTNTIPGFQCSCGIGYSLNNNGLSCDDINECGTANGGCEQNCTNTVGSFQCVCLTGFVLNANGFSCDDINECNTANGGCSQVCNNTIGSYDCFCRTGYELNVDWFACDDIDECDTANGGCGQFCTNTVGNFSCYCAPGYSLSPDGFACDGFDPVSHLSCSTVTSTSISINWIEPVCDTIGYGIVYLPTQGFVQPSPMTSIRSPGDTNATISGLFSGVQYSISVLAFGLWNDSASVSIDCITGLPPPTNVTFSLDSRESVTVHWSQPGQTLVLGYRAWLTDKETMSVTSSRHLPQSATSATFTSLVPATEYVVSVSCVSAFFEGPLTEVTFVTETDPPVRLFVDGISHRSLALFWTPPVARLIGYELTYGSIEQHRRRRSTVSVTLPGYSDNYVIQDLVPATQYVFILTAVSRFGRSTTITLTGITGTDPPSDLKVHKVSPTWLYVKWTPPVAAVVSYHLEVIEPASQVEMHFSISPSLTAFNTTNLVPTTKYTIRLAAVSVYGRSVNIETFGSTVAVSDFSILKKTTSATTTERKGFWTTDAFWFDQLYTTPSIGSTLEPKRFVLEELETTTMSATTANGYGILYHTVESTLTLLQRIKRLTVRVDQSLQEETSSENTFLIVTEIHDLFQIDSFPVSSTDFLIELEAAIELYRKSSELVRASQGTKISTMETINDVSVQTVSRLVQMLPVGNSTVFDTSVDLFQMDVIDINSPDISPKQQLKTIKDKQFNFELQLRKNGLSLVEASDRTGNALLAILPDANNYYTVFEEDNVVVVVARVTTGKNVVFREGDVNVSASVTDCSVNTSTDATMVMVERNLFSWNTSTFGQNVTTPIIIISLGDRHIDNCSMQVDLETPIALELTEQPRRKRRALQEGGFGGTQLTVSGARTGNMTMAHHAFDVPASTVVVVMQLSWWDHAAAYRVFFRYDSPPTEELYDGMDIAMEEDVVLAWHRGTRSLRTWIPNIEQRRGKLYVGIQTAGPGLQTAPLPEDYELRASTVSCLSWEYTSEKWGNTQCGVLLDLSNSAIRCNCSFPRLKAVIGASEMMSRESAAPRRKNQLPQLSILPPDRMPAPYLYQITVNTGSMFGAATSSRVGFQIFGSRCKTAAKTLNPTGESLVRGGSYDFIMPMKNQLGRLEILHIWHDNTGGGDAASWFLRDIIVKDMQADTVYQFVCYDWLSDARGDYRVQKVLHAATQEQLRSFGSLFRENTNAMFYDQHMWTSPVLSPEGSSFSKTERLSCCWAIVNSMMVASAMWFRDDNDDSTRNIVYNLGFIQFTLQELWVSLVTTVMVIPVTVGPLLLFRKEIPAPITAPGIRRRNQAGKRLSRWTKYVAWLIVVSVSIVSSFFVIMYGLDWGKEKSEAWLKSFFLSFCLSSVVAETGQIFILALIAALICNPTPSNKQRTYDIREEELHQDKDPSAYHASQTLSSRLTEDFDSITTPEDFWSWTEGVMLPVLYPSFWYNGWKMKYLDRQFPLYTEAFRIGPPRLTQIRAAPDTMELDDSTNGWMLATGNVSHAHWEFNVTSMVTVYPNCISECPMELPTTLNEATSTMTALQHNHWIDKFTKRLDLELSFYYPSPVGTHRLFQYENVSDYGVMTAHILFIMLFLVRLINDAIAIKKEGMKYFGSIWNLMASLSILGSAAAICIFGIRYHFASATLDRIVEATGELGIDKFVDFESTFWWDDAFKYVLAAVVFVDTLALLRMVKFNKTIAHFLALPGAMKNDLMGFSVVSAIAFMAFSSSGMIVFGTHMKAFSNAIHTNFALFEMLLGRFVADEILEANRYVGPVYFTFFMIFIFILLVNFLVTIICDAIASGDSIDDDYDQDLVDYIWTSFKEMLGIHSPPTPDTKTDEDKLSELNENLRKIEASLDDTLDVTKCLWPKIDGRCEVSSSYDQYLTPRHLSATLSSDTCPMIQEESTLLTSPAVSAVQQQVQFLLKAHEDDAARLQELQNESRRRAEAILQRKLAERRRKEGSGKKQTIVEAAQDLMQQHAADEERLEKRQKSARRLFESKLRQKLAARRVQKKGNIV